MLSAITGSVKLQLSTVLQLGITTRFYNFVAEHFIYNLQYPTLQLKHANSSRKSTAAEHDIRQIKVH